MDFEFLIHSLIKLGQSNGTFELHFSNSDKALLMDLPYFRMVATVAVCPLSLSFLILKKKDFVSNLNKKWLISNIPPAYIQKRLEGH